MKNHISQILKATAALAVIISSAGCTAGCRPGYIMHAAMGEIHLLSNAVPVQEALKSGALNASQRERILLISQIKAFGEKELGLKKTSSYETIYMGSAQSPIFTVSAAPKDKLALKTWWFPVVGKMPYLGFFDLSKARKEEQKLLNTGLDAFIGQAEAYSTLGWFSDPITLNLINGTEVDLAEVILHEMTHATLYVKGQGEFNEGSAQTVGKWGAFQFFERNFGPSHPLTLEAMASIQDERLFSAFMINATAELQRLYDSDLSFEEKLKQREGIFKAIHEIFENLKSSLKTNRFSNFEKASLNNAYLMAVSLYHRNYPLFESLLREEGNSIKEMLIYFRNLSERQGNILETARSRVEK